MQFPRHIEVNVFLVFSPACIAVQEAKRTRSPMRKIIPVELINIKEDEADQSVEARDAGDDECKDEFPSPPPNEWIECDPIGNSI